MDRKVERRLIFAAGIWQIVDGILTIVAYGTFIKLKGASKGNLLNFANAKAMQSLFGSLYIFLVAFGVALIGLGLLNIYLAKVQLKSSAASFKIPVFVFVQAILAYFCMDLITTALLGLAGIIYLAKSNATKALERQ